ncbi:hypothetical protein D8674_011720 [Pyrus ussuriensis x Pyrus communis]|uniref:B box-type domain-containing protein n=1 Tax=Pyrus ussuriensis x Pyrus communis TaxID=2448454 RepID=A0A5N5G553_9ROSA|nr:protein RGF1 INDUCIBLE TRANSCRIPTION FACTOR 1-like [Pyrus x bretschneideri]KAB2608552.1 hypothetical protein D8674_011720 [Pyrus ussuriensis x Pyrus communis]
MDRTMLVPPWLEQLLKTSFFRVCRTHGDATRSECNMFCLDCSGDAFCFYCRSSGHKDHQVIQIRRSSYHDVVRVSEVQKALDINGVQTYVINSARVMFLNERPQPKAGSKGSPHICELCGRSLLDPVRFCSLGCKLAGIHRNGDANFTLEAKDEEAMGRREELRGGSQHDICPPTPPPPPSTARRRKGIPHRAPFGS